MKVILFGASGMIGQGVLRECVDDAGLTEILAIVRRPIGADDAKVRELVHDDFFGIVTTTANVGRAMIRAAREGYERRVLEVRDIDALAA